MLFVYLKSVLWLDCQTLVVMFLFLLGDLCCLFYTMQFILLVTEFAPTYVRI